MKKNREEGGPKGEPHTKECIRKRHRKKGGEP